MSNASANLVAFSDFNRVTFDPEKSPNYWRLCYEALIVKDDPFWPPKHPDTFLLACSNPYYAAVSATAFTLRYGNFRGYEHFASTYFSRTSAFDTGITISKERTRTHIEHGNYVTDWYVQVDVPKVNSEFEQMFRAAVGILSSAFIERGPPYHTFLIDNELNIRVRKDADQKTYITSKG